MATMKAKLGSKAEIVRKLMKKKKKILEYAAAKDLQPLGDGLLFNLGAAIDGLRCYKEYSRTEVVKLVDICMADVDRRIKIANREAMKMEKEWKKEEKKNG